MRLHMEDNELLPIARPNIDKKEAQAVYDCIMSGWITMGKKVEELNINSFGSSTLDLNVKSLKQGIYMVSLSTGNSIVQTQRLIIKH